MYRVIWNIEGATGETSGVLRATNATDAEEIRAALRGSAHPGETLSIKVVRV